MKFPNTWTCVIRIKELESTFHYVISSYFYASSPSVPYFPKDKWNLLNEISVSFIEQLLKLVLVNKYCKCNKFDDHV